MISIGIDCGLTGAVAVLADGLPPNPQDMPVYSTHKGKSIRHHYDIKALYEMLRVFAPGPGLPPATVYLERQQAMPGQGVTSMFSIGYGFGLIEGLLVALGLPYVVVGPQAWQKVMLAGTSGTTKERALTVARRLYPTADLGRRKDAGRADALLIAEWGRRQATPELNAVRDVETALRNDCALTNVMRGAKVDGVMSGTEAGLKGFTVEHPAAIIRDVARCE